MTKDQIVALEAAVERQRVRNTQYRAYNEKDVFVYQGESIFSVLDFWRFSYSQLLGMSETIAEFLVYRSLGIEKAENLNYWTAYDLSYRGKRIEVKATSYVHPWNKKVSQVRTFSIAPSKDSYWRELPGQNKTAALTRQSELYVFCLNLDQDIDRPDPLKIDNWEFYVIPTFVINDYCRRCGNPNQKKISLTVVRRLADRTWKYADLKEAIEGAIAASDARFFD